MKILIISTWYPFPPNNGSKLRAYYLIKALSQSHQVSLVSFQPEEDRNHGAPRLVPTWPILDDPFRHVTLPQFVKYLSPIPLFAWPSSKMRKTIAGQIPTQQWDAVIAIQTPAARYALIPDCSARILDLDNSLSYMTEERISGAGSTLSRFKARSSLLKTVRYETNMAKKFDACTVVSSLEVGYIKDMVAGTSCHVAVSPNGVDCEHNHLGLGEPKPNSLIYNGSLTYSANYDAMKWFLAEIYPLIQQETKAVSLSITGSTRNVDLEGLALDPSTTLTGFVDDIRIPVAESAVCVVPIRKGSGTRLKILEAMALGTPVISTTKGAEGLDVLDGEHLLIADTSRQFADKVAELFNSPAVRETLRANARKLVVEKYDWKQIGSQFVELVENMVKSAAE